LVLVTARSDELAGRRQVDFSEVVERDFVGLITSSALHAHVTGHAARLGARLRFRARLNNFDAIGEMVAAGIGVAVMPEVAARRCARTMKINVVRIRDPWANRRLAICARSFKSLPRPAKQLVEHLRKAAQPNKAAQR
jgi:DNA-binding transcriptional LysR family regulator